jgi:diketogulonate reductase-like aldo/keto reductase
MAPSFKPPAPEDKEAYVRELFDQIAENYDKLNLVMSAGQWLQQVTLSWLLEQDGVAAIPNPGSPERMRENLGALDLVLDEDEMARIHALARGRRLVDPSWAVAWDPD